MAGKKDKNAETNGATNQAENNDERPDANKTQAELAGAGEDTSTSDTLDEVDRYEGTIAKIDKDGKVVMSDHVGPGERLKSEQDAEENEKAAERAKQRRKDAEREWRGR